MQNNPSGWDIENIGPMFGLLRCDLYHSVLFLFCVLKHYLAGEFIFHFPCALATWEAKYFRRCFNGTFDNWFWHFHQQNQPVFFQLDKYYHKPKPTKAFAIFKNGWWTRCVLRANLIVSKCSCDLGNKIFSKMF